MHTRIEYEWWMNEWIEWMHRRAITTHERIRYIIGMRNANANCLRFVVCEIECIFRTSSVSWCHVHCAYASIANSVFMRCGPHEIPNEWKNIDGDCETVNPRLETRNARNTRKMQIAEMQKRRTPSQLCFFSCLEMHPFFLPLFCVSQWSEKEVFSSATTTASLVEGDDERTNEDREKIEWILHWKWKKY